MTRSPLAILLPSHARLSEWQAAGAFCIYNFFGVPEVNVTGCVFDQCVNLGIYPGGAFLMGSASLQCSNISFVSCYSVVTSGAVFINGANAYFRAVDCEFRHCTAAEDGGAVYISIGSGWLERCVFEQCKALGGSGGAIQINGGKMNVISTHIAGCSSSGGGNSINIEEDGDLTLTGECTIEHSTAGDSGGIIGVLGTLLMRGGIIFSYNGPTHCVVRVFGGSAMFIGVAFGPFSWPTITADYSTLGVIEVCRLRELNLGTSPCTKPRRQSPYHSLFVLSG